MAAMRTITIEVPEALAREIDARISSGVCESESAFVLDSLSAALGANDEAENPEIERWLIEEVIPTYDRWQREKTPGIPSDQLLAQLKAARAARSGDR